MSGSIRPGRGKRAGGTTAGVGTTYAKLVGSTFFWGATFIAAKWTVGEAHPLVVAFTRFAVSTVGVFSMLAWKAWGTGGDGRFPVPRGTAQWVNLFSLGLTGVFLYNAFFLTGIKLTTAINGSLILATNPMLTAVLSALWLKERIRPVHTAGFVLSFLGVATVVSRGSWDVIRHIDFNPGDIMILGSSLSFAYFSVRGKKVLNDFSPLATTAYACLFGVLLFVALDAVAGVPFWAPPFSFIGWLGILHLALLSTLLGNVWWYEGVRRLGAGRASAFFNLVTVFAILLAAVFLNERLQWPQILGGAFVIAGVYLGTSGGHPLPAGDRAMRVEPAPGASPPFGS